MLRVLSIIWQALWQSLLFVVLIIGGWLAWANGHMVSYHLPYFGGSEAPLWLLLFIFLAVGFLAGVMAGEAQTLGYIRRLKIRLKKNRTSSDSKTDETV